MVGGGESLDVGPFEVMLKWQQGLLMSSGTLPTVSVRGLAAGTLKHWPVG